MAPAIQTVGASQTQELVIAKFAVPHLGVIQGINEMELPANALWVGENLHFFEGELRQRPSWNLERDTTLSTPAVAGTLTTIFTAHRATTQNQFLLVGGTDVIRILQDVGSGIGGAGWATWVTWAGSRAQTAQVRFTEIATGTPLVTDIIACNGVDVPVRMTLTATTAAIGASTTLTIPSDPRWKDVCMSADRIIGITDTEVNWGQNLNFTFPAAAIKSLAESLDLCIAIRPIGTLNVGIWKERSIWIGFARGGTDANFFGWRLLKWADGPAAPNALTTDTTGNWYWMTRTGRVLRMDESYNITYPGDGVWPIVRKEISALFSDYATSHAVYRPIHDEVWFFYPTNSTTYKAIVLCRASTSQPACFIATFNVIPRASGRVSENVFSSAANNIVDEVLVGLPAKLFLGSELQSTGTDTFTVKLYTGLQAARLAPGTMKEFSMTGGETHRVESLELFLRRGAGQTHPGTATINATPVTSNVLDTQAGTLGTAVVVPGLNTTPSPVKAVVGFDSTGRFFGFQLTGANANMTFRYLGALLRGRRVV